MSGSAGFADRVVEGADAEEERRRDGQSAHADGDAPSQGGGEPTVRARAAQRAAGDAAVRRIAFPEEELLRGTHAPTEAERRKVDAALHPEKAGAGPIREAGLPRDLFRALDHWMDYAFQRVGPEATHDLARLTPERLGSLATAIQDLGRLDLIGLASGSPSGDGKR